ncbi:hypothetical protein [Kitasatospora sp. NPDC007106]|uniref:hypothetical protein n=1 Tax=Kitasatospora sp. NPDC007106 TaxID=3156914 RepID=UPI0033C4DE41
MTDRHVLAAVLATVPAPSSSRRAVPPAEVRGTARTLRRDAADGPEEPRADRARTTGNCRTALQYLD